MIKEPDLLYRAESENAEQVLSLLEEKGWIGRVREDEMCFARDQERATLFDMRTEFPWRMPNAEDVKRELGVEHPMTIELTTLEQELKIKMGISVKKLLRD